LPLLAVCSTRRDDSCVQAQAFVDKARLMGVRMRVLREDLTHKQINEQLGLPGAYTDDVETFIGGLDEDVRQLLARK